MEQNTINGVWLEGQIDETGISLTLISETSESGAQVEEIKHFSFEELQSASGDIFSLNLSDESRSALRHSQQSGQSAIADYVEELEKEIEETNALPEEGDVLIDDNPAPWSDDKRIVVEEVTDKQANEWHIDEFSTVADANPSYPEDDTVIVGHYEVTEKSYAFPESRLVEKEDTLSQKEWHDQYGN